MTELLFSAGKSSFSSYFLKPLVNISFSKSPLISNFHCWDFAFFCHFKKWAFLFLDISRSPQRLSFQKPAPLHHGLSSFCACQNSPLFRRRALPHFVAMSPAWVGWHREIGRRARRSLSHRGGFPMSSPKYGRSDRITCKLRGSVPAARVSIPCHAAPWPSFGSAEEPR